SWQRAESPHNKLQRRDSPERKIDLSLLFQISVQQGMVLVFFFKPFPSLRESRGGARAPDGVPPQPLNCSIQEIFVGGELLQEADAFSGAKDGHKIPWPNLVCHKPAQGFLNILDAHGRKSEIVDHQSNGSSHLIASDIARQCRLLPRKI